MYHTPGTLQRRKRPASRRRHPSNRCTTASRTPRSTTPCVATSTTPRVPSRCYGGPVLVPRAHLAYGKRIIPGRSQGRQNASSPGPTSRTEKSGSSRAGLKVDKMPGPQGPPSRKEKRGSSRAGLKVDKIPRPQGPPRVRKRVDHPEQVSRSTKCLVHRWLGRIFPSPDVDKAVRRNADNTVPRMCGVSSAKPRRGQPRPIRAWPHTLLVPFPQPMPRLPLIPFTTARRLATEANDDILLDQK